MQRLFASYGFEWFEAPVGNPPSPAIRGGERYMGYLLYMQ